LLLPKMGGSGRKAVNEGANPKKTNGTVSVTNSADQTPAPRPGSFPGKLSIAMKETAAPPPFAKWAEGIGFVKMQSVRAPLDGRCPWKECGSLPTRRFIVSRLATHHKVKEKVCKKKEKKKD